MQKKSVFAVLLGNCLEFYDFTLFASLLPIIAPLLFPSEQILTSFTMGYTFLAIGFLARPVGAVLFGYIGDYYSRKRALILAVLMMSVSTLTIGVLPTYHVIGSYALLILVFCRILQGLSAGGEYSGAGLLLTENTKEEKRFLSGAVLTASGLVGAFIASTFAAMISMSFFAKESWRFLFLIGGCVGLVTLGLRLSTANEKLSEKIPQANTKSWLTLFKEYKLSLFCTISFGALMNVPFHLVTGFINTYFVAIGAYNRTTIMLINAFVILFCAIATVYFGLLSQRLNPLKMMFYASLGMILFSFPFFLLVGSGNLSCFVFAELTLILLSQLFVAPAFGAMTQLFPYSVRYRGIAVGNCLGLALLGGSTPYISAKLIERTSLSWSPAFYLFMISTLGFIAVITIIRNKDESQSALNPRSVPSFKQRGLQYG
jgi:MHS family proline/betaine transporter-like MFS transporter